MGKIVKKNQPCLACESSDARQIYEDGSSFCFKCEKYFKAGYREGEQHVVESKKYESALTVDTVKGFGTRGFKERKITKATAEFFNVKVSVTEDGEIDGHYYPYSNGGYKHRKLPKTFTWVGPSGGLFGKDQFNGGGKRVIITEGEIDAMSIAQATFEKYNKYYPVVSIPSATATKELLENREWLRSFKEVILCLDNDDAGKEATAKAIRIIGFDKVKLWQPGDCKDANEVLTKHGSDRLQQLIWDSAPWSPAGIISKDDIWKQITERNSIESVPYPPCLAGVNTKLKGMRMGEIVLLISGTGCLGYNTPILMYDGSLKSVQDIIIGDVLMGPDNQPRNVSRLCRGTEQMYRVSIRGNESFVCNGSHILSVVNNDSEGRWGLTKNEIVDVKLTDYLAWSDKRKHLSKAFKAGPLEFETAELPLHPYAMGVWLGDGYSAGSRISSNDIEIPNRLAELGYDIEKQVANFAWSFRGIQHILKSLNLINNKHIPELYLKADLEQRLQLLAGLIDTDGSYDEHNNGYEFSQKSELITDQFIRLVNSLGFQATKGKQTNNKFGNCFRVWVSGEGLEKLPVSLERKRAKPRQQIKNPLRFKMEVEALSVDNFYGFEVDSDGRFVLGNFIVTHNSGKSTIIREIQLHVLNTVEDPAVKIGVISLEESPGETGMKLAGMAINRNPANEEISDVDLKVGFDTVFGEDRVVVLDHQGSIKDDSIVDQLEYMCLMGCKYLFIDHITILVSEGADGLTGNEAIDKIMNDLLRLVKTHNVCIILVSHLRKVQTGTKSFEQGKLPTMDDIRGSGSIKQVSFDIIGFARDMGNADEEERNTIKMAVLKGRTVGQTGPVRGAVYNRMTGRLAVAADEAFDIL